MPAVRPSSREMTYVQGTDSQALVRAILVTTHEPIAVADDTSRVVATNPALAALLRTDEDALLGRPVLSLLGPDADATTAEARAGRRATCRTSLPGGAPVRILALRVVSDAGEGPAFVLISVQPEATVAQAPPGALPIGEEPEAERLRLLLEGVRDYSVFLLDRVGHVQTWNPGAERIYGYTPDEIVGRHFSCLPVHPRGPGCGQAAPGACPGGRRRGHPRRGLATAQGRQPGLGRGDRHRATRARRYPARLCPRIARRHGPARRSRARAPPPSRRRTRPDGVAPGPAGRP